MFYKLRFTDEWQVLPQRRNCQVTVEDTENLTNLYENKIPITQRKFQDLQYLKTTMPSDYHSFYDNISYE